MNTNKTQSTDIFTNTEFEQTTLSFIDFLSRSPGPFHAIANFEAKLLGCGFRRLYEEDSWQLRPGGDYFIIRADSSLIAFRVPEADFENFQVVACHSDSPSFWIKENPEIGTAGHYISLNIEKYGGMLLAPWLDRPLSVAGRVLVRNEDILESKLVSIDRDLCLIPNLAIHMNRKANEDKSWQIQKELLPLFGEAASCPSLKKLIAQQLQTEEEQIVTMDLFLYNRVPGCIWGAGREFFSAGRIDDLQCAYSAVNALMDGTNEKSVCVAAIFDHEEVGSKSPQGADSDFLSATLERISTCLNRTKEQHQMAIAGGFLVSADNGHALHPNYPETADPVNRPVLNQGPVVKYSASRKYVSDAITGGIFREICERAKIPVQVYTNNADITGGSTLGSLSATQLSIPSVDIGLAQLAMHSPYETGGVKDTAYLTAALTAFYRTHIRTRHGSYYLE